MTVSVGLEIETAGQDGMKGGDMGRGASFATSPAIGLCGAERGKPGVNGSGNAAGAASFQSQWQSLLAALATGDRETEPRDVQQTAGARSTEAGGEASAAANGVRTPYDRAAIENAPPAEASRSSAGLNGIGGAAVPGSRGGPSPARVGSDDAGDDAGDDPLTASDLNSGEPAPARAVDTHADRVHADRAHSGLAHADSMGKHGAATDVPTSVTASTPLPASDAGAAAVAVSPATIREPAPAAIQDLPLAVAERRWNASAVSWPDSASPGAFGARRPGPAMRGNQSAAEPGTPGAHERVEVAEAGEAGTVPAGEGFSTGEHASTAEAAVFPGRNGIEPQAPLPTDPAAVHAQAALHAPQWGGVQNGADPLAAAPAPGSAATGHWAAQLASHPERGAGGESGVSMAHGIRAQSSAAVDASVPAPNPAAMHGGGGAPGHASGRGAEGSAAAGGSATFAALDAEPAAGAPGWIHAGAHQAEAGFEDPALGWVGVRADLGAGGVHAAIVPGSAAAAQALGGHLAGLGAHLAAERIPVQSLSMAAAQGRDGFGAENGPMQQGAMQQGAGQQEQNAGQSGTLAGSSGQRSDGAGAPGDEPVASDLPVQIAAGQLGQVSSGLGARGSHVSVMA